MFVFVKHSSIWYSTRMIKKTLLYFWSLRREFAKYFIIGISGVILDIGTLYLLKEYGHIRPVIAVIINQAFLINYSFFLNKFWAFKSKGMTHRQMVRFYFLAGLNYLFSIAWMWVFNEHLGLNYLVARLANIALCVAWNFLLYKYWVYRTEHSVERETHNAQP